MVGRMDGKVVLVVGAGDVAVASARLLAVEGATVVSAEADAEPVDTVELAVRTYGALNAVHLVTADTAEAWCVAGAPVLAAGAGGAIVTTVSTRALAGDRDRVADATAGGAVVALTLAMATIYGKRGVRVNCIAVPPDDVPEEVAVASSLVPRAVQPDDVAGLALFLLSADASFVTGQVLRCDGGQLAHLPHYASLVAAGATTAGRAQ